jgi:hypothetical protein
LNKRGKRQLYQIALSFVSGMDGCVAAYKSVFCAGAYCVSILEYLVHLGLRASQAFFEGHTTRRYVD